MQSPNKCKAELLYYISDDTHPAIICKFGYGVYAVLKILDNNINHNKRHCLALGDLVICKLISEVKENILYVNKSHDIEGMGKVILILNGEL